ncbi:MAG: alpha/beta hydrolase [Dehalococcoidales bacterium]|nr:MAG: alpha/beta hydrolase [Dehalococcoidales bacterium]
MPDIEVKQGHFNNGIPYARFGHGSSTLVAFNGLAFNHAPPSGLFLRRWTNAYSNLADSYTIYALNRKKGLPDGYTLADMSNDYATMIKEELSAPVDVLGVSLGGSIAQHLASDYPDLVRKLVIVGCGYCFGDEGRELAVRLRDLTLKRKWRRASATLGVHMAPQRVKGYIFSALMFAYPVLYSPTGPSDGVIEINAQLQHNFKERLSSINSPTLVAAGDRDSFTPEALLRETADNIPNSKLIIYPGMGHDAAFSKTLAHDVLNFLKN